MATNQEANGRDQRGRFTKGNAGGPGRPKRTAIPGAEVARLARPLNAIQLMQLASAVQAQATASLGPTETLAERMLDIQVKNRHLAAMVLNRRLMAEAAGEP